VLATLMPLSGITLPAVEEVAPSTETIEPPMLRDVQLEVACGQFLTIVGVVARVKLRSLGEQGGFVRAYVPARQSPDIQAGETMSRRRAPQ
jgi:hypothetical protein